VILDGVDDAVFDDYLNSLYVAVEFVMDGMDLKHSFDASWTLTEIKRDLARNFEVDTLHLDNANESIPDDINVTHLPSVEFRIATGMTPSLKEVLTILAAVNSVSREFTAAFRDGREIHDGIIGDDIEIQIRMSNSRDRETSS
jgi:hypothetical protein